MRGGAKTGDWLATADSNQLDVTFSLPAPGGATYLTRTHPFVEGLASYVLDTALDPLLDGVAKRCGAIRTRAVSVRTTILVLRLRHHIVTRRRGEDHPLLAEDCHVVGFERAPHQALWLDEGRARELLDAAPAENIGGDVARDVVERVLGGIDALVPHLEDVARGRAEAALEAHRRVRTASRLRGESVRVEPMLPVDVMGVYVLLPAS